MPNGYANGSGGGTPPPAPGYGGGYSSQTGGVYGSTGTSASRTPKFQKTKSIAYGTSDEILSLVSTAAVDAPSESMPSMIELTNNGGCHLLLWWVINLILLKQQ